MVKKTSKDMSVPKTVKNSEFNSFIDKKLSHIIDIIQRTYLSLSFCKQFDIFSKSSIGQCVDHLQTIYESAKIMKDTVLIEDKDMDITLTNVQSIFDKLSIIFSTYGTYSTNDVYYVVFGTKYNKFDTYDAENAYNKDKLDLIEKYIIPIGYKNLPWSECNHDELETNKIVDVTLQIDKYAHLECFEPTTMYSSIHQSVYGVRILIRNTNDKKLLLLSGLVKDIPIQYLLDNIYIKVRLETIRDFLKDEVEDSDLLDRWMDTLSVKDVLIYSVNDLLKKFNVMLKDVESVKNNRVDNIVKKFFEMDLVSRRKMLINLFAYNTDNEVQYIAYMLYDLMGSVDSTDGNDNNEQLMIYESLPWKLKQFFKETMINTIEYTQDSLSTCDLSKISLEQQVLLMKADDKIKNRAKIKLKEIKQKSDDQGNKSKQYLEGLVRVPFGIFRKEPVLCVMNNLNQLFNNLRNMVELDVADKDKYTLYEINQNRLKLIKNTVLDAIANCESKLSKSSKEDLAKSLTIFVSTLTNQHKTKAGIIKSLKIYLNNARTDKELTKEVFDVLKIICPGDLNNNINNQLVKIGDEISNVEKSMTKINDYLDDSIYGHDKAKQQILKIVGQWINGEQKGYCFGFEGSPGVGKTSLAKRGLSRCLTDENGEARPFSFIALGGSSNGSTLEGHNYTYVNSTHGKIVDILMESKCMNPIIYIDELDKVSKTEQGREIIGILTHLIDTTQNDEFQDKYFSGVPFDLSKALFIFSYNDPEQIDRILLDRIHRIRFDNLSWSDKIVIVNKFIMPELNEKMGFENTVKLTDDVIRHIIESYTMEPGVRKLKEVLFDLFGEINLNLLNFTNNDDENEMIELPIVIKIEDFGTKYLKKQRKVSDIKIHPEPLVGTINGMWANALGKGGIIPIETRHFPASSFLDLKLTGMQGDVMKESMTVAKTLAWTLTSVERQKELTTYFEETKNQGLHIHCPEGAVSKDGPSAGGAITLTIYSLLNNIKIKNTISMTGETNLRGRITAIGGLDTKIIGSMKAGVKTILFPKENQDDFDEFMEKYKDVLDLSEMTFHPVDTIQEAMKIVFD